MIRPADSFLTSTLREYPWGRKISRILAASLAAVDPAVVLNRSLQRDGNIVSVAGQEIRLDDYKNVYLLAIGKASIPMAVAAADLVSDHLTGGVVLSKSIDHGIPDHYQEKIRLYQGDHPIPDQNSLRSTEEILSLFSSQTSNDLVIVLISGGGSALFTSPQPGISLKDLQQANQVFLESGLIIQEVNTIRKHISQVKGGQLAGHLYPARTISVILSDVIGDPIDMIASGPTVPDPTTYADALAIIRKYQLMGLLPSSIHTHLEAGAAGKVPETPKEDDPIFQGQTNMVIAGIQDAMNGALKQAQLEGYQSQISPNPLEGEAKLVGERLAKILCQLKISESPGGYCLVTGGETTVSLTGSGQPGRGGRNLELALGAVRQMSGHEGQVLITLASDGEDGVTDSAGAVVNGETLTRAEELGLNPDDFLARHDSYTFFKALDDLLLPGATGTNVNDLCFLFKF